MVPHHADLGRLADRRLEVLGRADHLIVTGGENVWPEPVEAALATHPDVADVRVHGEPDDEWGQRVVATVVPVDPAAPPTLAALRARAKGSLPAAATPRAARLAGRLAPDLAGQAGALKVGRGYGSCSRVATRCFTTSPMLTTPASSPRTSTGT
ncbi:MAG: hypothetical protein R2711_15085 [Acidimicrobiales bacterium]